ncbi:MULTISPECIES: hypothetical protein [unclassified Gordonia (in: high G+C Gram-positive bacteria)]|uniref:hypothetical protein n=1 Tax=unclassified Gordonia (in: high G+C Gram-positive bacteria) TaxID=2657482 RepID=UPI00083B671C|nr:MULTISPECIES: hypothetical protein [unclassified Gordonia (in: high G+C Gram-positive bacteria)]MBN0975494.1 hypothetical protein [Gordonia sp. BP-119]MBN0984035.1 hypothetical protein [Gordonia sp. BP-94]OCW85633.1 hypothetical protein A8M60_04850 [Nocardia farcinica]WGJ84193.1 hypothetical protein QAD21_15510 [Gordonia sp. SMJS1]
MTDKSKPPQDVDYSIASQLVWWADDTTSSYRDDGEDHYELARPNDYVDDPTRLRPVLVALLQRLRQEFQDAPTRNQLRVIAALRAACKNAPRDFDRRDMLLAAMTILTVLRGAPTDLGDDLIARRLVPVAAIAADIVVGLIGTEAERRDQGLPPDPHAIID